MKCLFGMCAAGVLETVPVSAQEASPTELLKTGSFWQGGAALCHFEEKKCTITVQGATAASWLGLWQEFVCMQTLLHCDFYVFFKAGGADLN